MIDIWPGLAGGVVAGAILIAQHYKMNRAKLKRQHAYIAGVLALDAGFLIFILVAGLPFGAIIGLVTVEAVSGGAVLIAYKKDETSEQGQLQEALNRADRAERELVEARTQIAELQKLAASGPVKVDQLLDMFAPLLTARTDLEKGVASLEVSFRHYYKLQAQARHGDNRIEKMNAARAAKKGEAKGDG